MVLMSRVYAKLCMPRNEKAPFRRRGTACRPLVPHSPCGTPGRASPTLTSSHPATNVRDRWIAQRKALRQAKRRAALCAILVGGAGPTAASRDCLRPFGRRLRLCDPEVATANSAWELTVGSRSKEKPGPCGYVARGCKSSGWIGASPVKRLKSCGFKVSR